MLVTCVLLISVTKGAPGTTLNIQRIFIGRCFEYQELSRGKIIEPRSALYLIEFSYSRIILRQGQVFVIFKLTIILDGDHNGNASFLI